MVGVNICLQTFKRVDIKFSERCEERFERFRVVRIHKSTRARSNLRSLPEGDFEGVRDAH